MKLKHLWLVAIAGGVATPALADFMEDWDHPYKWDQMQPDLEWAAPSFYDDLPFVVEAITADDWLCTETSFLTDVHFVGFSLYGNFWIDHFRLTIYDDVPAIPGVDESHPGEVLWTYDAFDWVADEVTYFDYGLTLYDINLPEPDWWLQQGTPDEPVIYWIGIQGIMSTDAGYTDEWYWSFRDRYLPTNLDDAAFWSDYYGAPPWANWGWPDDTMPAFFDGPFPPDWWKSADMAFGLTFIPAPASIALLGLGGLITIRRR
ncbi:MAG: hypothetical protein ACF8NJ_02605 [Phycisphaerales bacterium JB038]